ncbi:MAG: SUMF1/EgtB/PvdO family nonheme iron enzyme [Bryobacterales bacterium]|nr:SUMF1/EgtB/PvdO family nonheme iron enzyme [Bryobacterales bacterium]
MKLSKLRTSLPVLATMVFLVIGRPTAIANDWDALKRAIEDLSLSFPKQYTNGPAYLKRLQTLESERQRVTGKAEQAERIAREFDALRREALLANPLLSFDRLLLIKRDERKLGLVQNWESNEVLAPGNYDNEIDVFSVLKGGGLTRLYRPPDGGFVGDLNLHFDAKRLLFSMRAANGRFQVFELNTDGSRMRQLSLINEPDVDNYEGCYLPNGDVVFCSTAPFIGVPCVQGHAHISQLYRYNSASGTIRRLAFDQDHNWCPTVMNDGRLMYLRWEYSDIPHFAARILFTMNPDGTEQKEFYGSNSYWPNSMFYARQIPGNPTRFVAVVGGHHGVPRMGELVLFDAARGRHEAEGVIQRIPGYGKKVEPIIKDQLADDSWPKFLHPHPLSDKYFLVSAKPDPKSAWGIYLVDVFDNMLLLKSVPGYALLEPTPLQAKQRPPVVVDRVNLARKDATVVLQDIYAGPGLKGVPRGSIKQLRVLSYHFAYQGMGGEQNRVGMDGPWDIKRVLGTVPVEVDGSAYFHIPANTPISLQPLDGEGKAVQLMRSWLTGMPGETVSCVGCHEKQNTAPAPKPSLAFTRAPSEIKPWYGPTRGFSFNREVQPVLDRYCIGCHDGRGGTPNFVRRADIHPTIPNMKTLTHTRFPPAYLELRRYVRAATMESDLRGLPPYEFHADASKVVQLLNKGHYGVKLDAESWDRLITWIDVNTPAQGTWHEIVGSQFVDHQRDRRRELLKRYAGVDEDPEAMVETARWQPMKTVPDAELPVPVSVRIKNPAATAVPVKPVAYQPVERSTDLRSIDLRSMDLGKGVALKLRYVREGTFVMGDDRGFPDEKPAHTAKVDRGFWMGQVEVSNEQYARFDPRHDSFLERREFLQFSIEARGDPVNGPSQPVCRVSWEKAVAFCKWLSEKTGEHFRLPSEAEWEYAARAGSATPLWYGQIDMDFSRVANLADYRLKYGFGPLAPTPHLVAPYRPAVESVDDNFKVSAPVGSFQPNAWGLYDMAGNVAEWTDSVYQASRKVVRGGSWSDRPEYARSSSRKGYHPWQSVFDVGFRVVSDGPVRRGAQVTARR